MGLISWLSRRLGMQSVPVDGTSWADVVGEFFADVCIRDMAFWSAVNIAAKAICKCEIKTYVNGEEVRGPEYYLWNVEPNRNQSSSVFMHKLVSQLFSKNEALAIEQNGQLLLADSFIRKPYALLDDLFEQVTVGDFPFRRTFKQSEVLYWQLNSEDMHRVTNRIFDGYSRLLGYAMDAYQRSRGTKGVFEYDTLPVAGTEPRKVFDELINKRFAEWLNSDRAVIPLGKGQKFTELAHKTYASESTRDIRAMVDDICDFTAKGFGIPPALIRGDVQGVKDVTDQLLTFCVDPLADIIQEEANRKRSGRAGFLAGTYMQIDTTAVKHMDLFDIAAPIEKLIGSGVCSVNDILKQLGKPTINEPWADEHFFTKNFSTIEEALRAAAQKGST